MAVRRDTRRRILYVTAYYKPAYVYGGPVQSVSLLCEGMVGTGTQVTVFTTNANGDTQLDVPLGRQVDVNGVGVHYFPLALRGFFFYAPSLADAIKSEISRYDLVVAEGVYAYPLHAASLACQRAGIPYVVSLRGELLPWSRHHKAWKKGPYLALFGKRRLNSAAALHCTDQEEVEATASLGLKPPLFLVPNAVDTTRFSRLPDRGLLRRDLGIPKDAAVLLFFGRLHQKKRPELALEVLAEAHVLPRQVHLVFAGADEQHLVPSLEARAARLGCAERVHFTGLLEGDAVLHALADADLLLMPSELHSENFGRSAAEAMAAGLPVLVSEGVPVGRWAEQAGAGVVASTAEEFRHAAVDLLANPSALAEMGKRGQQLARREFEATTVVDQMLAQYESIIVGHGASGVVDGRFQP